MVSDAYKFIIPVLFLGVLLLVLHLSSAALLLFAVAAFICFFFRNPARKIPDGENLVISPADGKVVKIQGAPGGEQTISIFLNILTDCRGAEGPRVQAGKIQGGL
jgi:phosphatidylserine decarboxylase